jgi:hypothetical protein
MHRLLDNIDVFVIGYGTDWTVKGRSGCDRGCRGSEFSRREKTLVLQKAYTGCSTDKSTYIRGMHY